MHRITVDTKRCRGTYLCHQCDAIKPGLVLACERDGHVVVQDWVLRDQGGSISALIASCPDQAIMIFTV